MKTARRFRFLGALVLFVTVMTVASIASADNWVHVNFGKAKIEAELVGPAGGSGERWNQAGTAISAAGLTNSTGAATTIGWAMGGGSLTTGNDWNNAANLEMLESAFFQANATARTLTISGLDSSKTYDLYIASYDQNSWGIGEMTFSTTGVGDQVAANTGGGTTWALDDNYVVFEGLVPDVSNNIAILGTETGAGSYGFWSGFQLREIVAPDLDPPTVGTLRPTNGAIDVGIASDFTISFNEEVQKGSGNILIRRVEGNTIFETIDVTSSAVTVSTTNVTINPTSDLELDTNYWVEIPNGVIQDLAGNPFAGIMNSSQWAFTTVATIPPPGVTTAGGATDIGVGTASLRAELTNGVAADVYICWGADAGDDASTSSWENVVSMGSLSDGEVVTNAVSGLYYGVEYSYAVYASNATDVAWSTVTNFTTRVPQTATLAHDTVEQIYNNGGSFNISVYAGKAAYSGNGYSGPLGDGTVSDYRFLNSPSDALSSYADGGAGLVGMASAPAGNINGAGENWANVWTANDPGSNFSTSPNFSTANDTLAMAQNVTGSIDISGLDSGTVYFIYGSYEDVNTVSLTMSGSGQADKNASHTENPPDENWGWISRFSFTGATDYDSISYTYSNNDADGSRARFMGVIIDGAETVGPHALSITNTAAANLTSNSADLLGALDATQSVFTVYAYWSTNDYTGQAAWESGSTVSNAVFGTYTNVTGQSLSNTVSSLDPATTYYFTYMASNAVTNLWADGNASFTTLAEEVEPLVDNNDGATVGSGTATLRGMMTAGGLATAYICWGTEPGDTVDGVDTGTWDFVSAAISVSDGVAFSNAVSSLYYGIEYDYAVYATNSEGEDWSSVATFVTTPPSAGAPAITTTASVNLTSDSADLLGSLDATQSVFTVHAYWSTNSYAGAADWTNAVAGGTASSMEVGTYTNVMGHSVTGSVSGLLSGTDYYYTLMATNAATNIWASPNGVFATPGTPTVDNAGGATHEGPDSAVLNGRLLSGGFADAYLVWGTNAPAGLSTGVWEHVEAIGEVDEGAPFWKLISGLEPDTTYYYRCFVTNAVDASWSSITNFTTTESLGILIYSTSFEIPDIVGRVSTKPTDWVGGSYLDRNEGLEDEGTGTFTTPYGAQAACIWNTYSQTVLTTAESAFGDTLVSGITYTIRCHVATASDISGAYKIQLMAFAPGQFRATIYNSQGGEGGKLAEVSGTATTTNMSEVVTLTYTAEASDPFLGYMLGVRIGQGSVCLVDNLTFSRDGGAGDIDPPIVLSRYPQDNSSTMALDYNLIMTFSEAVTNGTGNITIKKTDDDSTVETIDVTSGQVTISGDTVTITRSQIFENDTSYYVLIDDTAFVDMAANAYAGIASKTGWNFATPVADGSAVIYETSFESPVVSGRVIGPPDGWETGTWDARTEAIENEDSGTYSTPYGSQAVGMGGGESLLTTKESTFSDTLVADVPYAVTFNVALPTNAVSGAYRVELIAFDPGDLRNDIWAVNRAEILAFATGTATQTNMSAQAVGFTYTADGTSVSLGRLLAVEIDQNTRCLVDNLKLTWVPPPPSASVFRFR